MSKATRDLRLIFETCHRSSFELWMADQDEPIMIGKLEPTELWDVSRMCFLTQGDLSFAGYLELLFGKNSDATTERFILTLSFQGPRGAPLVGLVHPNAWAGFDTRERVLGYMVIGATEEQKMVSGGVLLELSLEKYKVMASLRTVENGGVPVHQVILKFTPHDEDSASENGMARMGIDSRGR